MDTLLAGLKLMLLAGCILVLAWSLGTVTKDTKLADYVITLIGEGIPYGLIVIMVFGLGMLIAFATGTSWGTMTILTPIAIPLVYKLTGDPIAAVTIAGVVFSGAIFGDHCSPISDTTVLSSIFAGADHMDHVSTQIPYAITVAAVAGGMFYLYGATNLGPVVLIPLGFVMLLGLVYILSNFSAKGLAASPQVATE